MTRGWPQDIENGQPINGGEGGEGGDSGSFLYENDLSSLDGFTIVEGPPASGTVDIYDGRLRMKGTGFSQAILSDFSFPHPMVAAQVHIQKVTHDPNIWSSLFFSDVDGPSNMGCGMSRNPSTFGMSVARYSPFSESRANIATSEAWVKLIALDRKVYGFYSFDSRLTAPSNWVEIGQVGSDGEAPYIQGVRLYTYSSAGGNYEFLYSKLKVANYLF